MAFNTEHRKLEMVAPYAGAWIEILTVLTKQKRKKSLPTRERGLKFVETNDNTPITGRSLRGSVD